MAVVPERGQLRSQQALSAKVQKYQPQMLKVELSLEIELLTSLNALDGVVNPEGVLEPDADVEVC